MTFVQALMQRTQLWLDRRPQFLLRLSIICAVLLTSLYMAYRAARVSSLNQVFYNPAPLLVVGVIASVIFLAHPKWGLVLLLPSFVLVVLDIGTGSGTLIGAPILLLLLLIGLWLFDMVARQRAIRFFQTRALAPTIAFLVASLVALGFGQLPWFDFYKHAPIRAQIGQIGIFVLSFATFLWVGQTLPDLRTLKTAVVLFFITSVFLMAGEYSGGIYKVTSRLVHYAVRNGSIYWVWLTALAFSQVTLNRKLPKLWRMALIMILLSVGYIGFFKYEGWTSGWFPPLVSVLVIVWFGFPKTRKWVVIGTILGVILFWPRIYSILTVGDNEYSITTRLAAWQIIFHIIPADPLFGLGPANYYWFTPLFSIMGYRVVFNSHNNFVDLIAQMGVVGIACFFWFAWAVLRMAWRLRDAVQDEFSRAYVYGVLGGWVASLAACMLGDWLLPFVYNVGYAGLRASLVCWFFLGGLLYLERMHPAEADPAPALEEQ